MNRGKVGQKLDLAGAAPVTRSDRFKSTLRQKSDPAISRKTATSATRWEISRSGGRNGGRGVAGGEPRCKFSRVGEATARVLGRAEDMGLSNLLGTGMIIAVCDPRFDIRVDKYVIFF